MRLQSWMGVSASCSLGGLDHSSPIKFDITKQYRLLSDFDDKNALDIEKYVKNLCKARVRDNDTIDEVEDAGVIET